jgi:hypothetical protein
LAFDESRISPGRSEHEYQSCSSFPICESSQPQGSACNYGKIEPRDNNEVIKSASLKLALDFRRQAEFPAEDHSENQALNVRSLGERGFYSRPGPVLDSIWSVPTPPQNRDQTGIPDGASPVDALTLEVAPVIKHARVPVGGRLAQLHHDLESVAGSQIQCLE